MSEIRLSEVLSFLTWGSRDGGNAKWGGSLCNLVLCLFERRGSDFRGLLEVKTSDFMQML